MIKAKTKTLPLISVIITYYKKKLFIKKTLNSILKQSYRNFELILVYDDYDKNDLHFIQDLLNKFKKKKIIINKKNLGVAKSRNVALKKSQGQYIAFIDSDDIWKKNKLLKQYRFMNDNSYNFCFTSYSIVNENDNIIKNNIVSQDASYKKLFKSNVIGLNTVMISRDLLHLIKFPILKTQEDFALWLKLSRVGVKLKHLNTNLSYWRKTKNSLSSNTIQKFIDAFRVYNNYEKKNFFFSFYSVVVLSYNKILKFF
jgi:teichuronic acid biosynthesis glycosyltransferase TuaG